MASKEQNTIIDPTPQELEMYLQLTADLDEVQMDNLANGYFEYINKKDSKKISFAKFVTDALVRPIQEGDTITYIDDKGQTNYLFCLIRKTIKNIDYLIFGLVDQETETIREKDVYLFFVEGKDELGMEIIDIYPAGAEAEEILDLIEQSDDVELVEVKNNDELAKETIQKEWEK